MKREVFSEKVQELVNEDPQYNAQAYHFMADAVSYSTQKARDTESAAAKRHIRGQELLEGIREYALEQFGPLTLDVFAEWGITRTEDFGNIVFKMVDKCLLGSSSQDSPGDFADGYDFKEAFLKPFVLSPGEEALPLPVIA